MKGFQQRVAVWCNMVFGSKVANDRVIRNYRFIEEALELVQSLGMSKQEVLDQVHYVFGRNIGEPDNEIGGVMITLAQLATVNNLDIDTCRVKEFVRIIDPEVVEHIKEKEAQKITKTGQEFFKLLVNEFNDVIPGIKGEEINVKDLVKHRPFSSKVDKIEKLSKPTSSTGKPVRSNSLLYIYSNKCKQPFAGGLCVVIASNPHEAQGLIEAELEDWIAARYRVNDWKCETTIDHAGKPMFISEHSYCE